MYVDAEGPDRRGIARGLRWLGQEVEGAGADEGWLVVNTFDALTGVIADVIGEHAAKQLAKGEVVRIGQARVRCYSHKTLPAFRGASTILVLHPATNLLDRVDALSGVKAVAVIPWIRSEVNPWVATWTAAEVSGTPTTQPPESLSHVFRAALRDLTAGVNLGTGIGHPSDHDLAVHTLQALRVAGESLNAAALKSWLQRNHWSPDAANAVVDLAERIFAGRTVRVLDRDFDAQRALQRWREAAAGDVA